MKENIIQIKTLEFSIRLSRLYVILKDKKYYEIASQFFRSGTSMGTNVAEAQGATSKKDFINKMTIALKESYEALYRIDILEKGFDERIDDLKNQCMEIVRILVCIVKSSKENE